MTCIAGHEDIVELLLEKGADVNVADENNVAKRHNLLIVFIIIIL